MYVLEFTVGQAKKVWNEGKTQKNKEKQGKENIQTCALGASEKLTALDLAALVLDLSASLL